MLVGEPIVMDDGRIGHAELALAGGVLYLADEFPEIGLKAPAPQSVSVSLMLSVANTDAALERARAAGADVQREAYENYGSRSAAIIDPFGHRWMLSGPMTGAPTPIQHGDVGYVSVWTPDADRAAAFYGHVLGWTFDPQGHQVTNSSQHIGLFSVPGPPTLFCCYAVTDLAGARQSIIDGGGTAGEPTEEDFGTVLEATDPSGAAFAVYQPNPGDPRPELNGAGPGDLSYLTYEVADSSAFRAFYSRMLFWTYRAGPGGRRLGHRGVAPDGRGRGRQREERGGSDVDGRRHRRSRRPRARGGRHRHRRAVAAVLRPLSAVHRRPGQPLLPRRALTPRDFGVRGCAQRIPPRRNRYSEGAGRTSAIGAPLAILARAFITLPGIPPPTTPTTTPSRS